MALKQTKNRNGSVKSVPALRRCGLPLLVSVLLAAICLTAVRPAPPAFAQTETTGAQGRGSRPAGVTPKRPRGKAQPDSSSQKGDASSKGAPRAAAAKSARPTANAGLDALSPLLAAADFDLIGLAVTANPPSQTVPKNTPTSVLVSVKVPEGTDPAPIIAGLNPNYRVRGELTGPSLSGPRTIEAPVGQPLPIPPLAQAGEHLLQNLRVVDISQPDEAVVAPVTPDACGITVIERILVSEVHVNELTYDQIVQAGINISDDSYKAFNFTIGLGTTSNAQTINIPVAFPTVGVNAPLPVVGTPTVSAPGIDVPTVVPVLLTPSVEVGGEGNPAPELPKIGDEPVRIPGVVVFPGRVGFLHQFFEAIVIVSNGAPGGAPLVLRNLHAKAKLPDAGTPGDVSDDPLRIAETQTGGRVSELDLHGLGPDQKYGTADDTTSFGPGEAGQATFLLEGLKEGLHTVNFDLDATLEGLPSGPVKVTGTVPGAVLVRDASFAVTFTHPAVVRAGQEYDLAMTLLNTGGRDIQGAFARLAPGSISGAELVGQDTGERQFPTTIVRKDSATIKWRLRASTTGEVTASYVKVGDDVSAGLALVTGVGDRNVPLSPESLILPDPVRHLPPDFVEAARAVLGQAWGVANAPAGSLPAGVLPITKQSVIDRAVELGLAGMRVDFGETTGVSIETLTRDWLGELKDDPGFADALRETPAGNAYYDAIGTEIYKRLTASGAITAADYQRELADTESSRSPFISALMTHADGQPMAGVRLVNASNQRVGFGASPAEREVDLANGAALVVGKTDIITHAQTTLGQMALASNVTAASWTLELTGWRDGAADLSLLYPATGRTYRHVVWGGVPVTAGGKYRVVFRASSSSTATPALEIFDGSNYVPSNIEGVMVSLDQPAPRLVGAIQVTPDVVSGGDKYGRLVGLLFSKPMLKDQAETLSKYAVGGGQLKNTEQLVGGPVKVKGAHLDYGDRFVFLALDSPIGPYIRRDVTVSNLSDARRMALAPSPVTMSIDPRVSPEGRPPGAYLTGRVLNADGTPVAGANVIYWVQECPDPSKITLPPPPTPIAIRTTDAQGRYEVDYVRDGDCAPLSVTVTNPVTHSEKRLTSPVAYDGQHMVFDMVFLARGNVRGTVTSGGQPVAKAFVNIVPSLDVVGAQVVQTDDAGQYTASGIPVGNVSVFAVGTGDLSNSSGFAAGNIDGPNQTATINVSMQNTAGRVSGRVVRADGGPAVGALVVAYAVIPGVPSVRFDRATAVGYAYADRDGQFTVSKIPVGDVTLEVTDYVNGMQVSQRVTLTSAAPAASGLLLTLPGLGAISGRVLDETGAPVSGAVVSSSGRAVETDAQGNYTLTDLSAGTHSVAAYDQATTQSGATTAAVRIGQTTENVNVVILRPSSVHGRVMVLEEGQSVPAPLAGAYVSSDGHDLVQTDAQGNYTLPNVTPNARLTLRFFDTTKMLGANLDVQLAPGETLTRDVTFKPGTIRGRVTQPDGVTGTVADVQVYAPRPYLQPGPNLGLLDASNPVTTRSGPDGSYSVSGNGPGAFRVSTSNAFFPTPVSAGGVLAPSGVAECNLSLVSTLAGKIQGRVYRPDGTTPVGAGVRVTLGGGSLADATVRTDDTGHYEFGEVFSAGGYRLTATDPVSGASNQINVSVQRNKDAVFDLRLLGTGALRVKVVDGGGQPVTSGSVTLDGSDYPNAHRFAELTADGGGVITFDNLPEGAYAVAATNRGLGGRVAASVTPGGTVETTVQLQASGTVEGRVFMPGGTVPVGLADVELVAGGRSIGFAVTSDGAGDDSATGHFQFLNVPAGDFTLEVFDNRTGRAGRSAGHVGTQGETVTVNVEVFAIGAVTGRVTSNGLPVDHALVEIYADGSGLRSAHLKATTDEGGRYRFTGIPVGRFTVQVSGAPGGQGGSVSGVISGTVEPLPDTVADITLEPTQTVTGTVRKLGGAEPVPGALVTLRVGGSRFYRTAANDAGVYRVSFIPLGEVVARAEAPAGNDRGEAAPVTGTQPGGTITADVTFAGTGIVAGTATDNNGVPLAVGSVSLSNNDWGTLLQLNTSVRSDGSYEFDDVPAGNFTLKLSVPQRVGVGSAAGVAVANQTVNVPLRLEDAGRVVGRVLSEAAAAPVAGVDITLALWRQTSGTLFFYAHSDSQGAFAFENIPLGAVSLSLRDSTTGAIARAGNLSLATNAQVIDLGDMRLDATPIRVASVTPADGAGGLSPSSVTVTVNFSEPAQPDSVTSGALRLMRGDSGVSASVALASDGRSATLTPTGRLADTTAYTILVTKGLQDLAGNNAAADFTSTFTTKDETGPVVVAVSPADNATEVPVAGAVAVTFDEPLDAAQNLSNILKVSDEAAPDNVAAGAVALDASGRVLTFTHASELAPSRRYRVSVAGQRDVLGNVQTAPFGSVFTTFNPPPTVELTSPAQGTQLIQGQTVQLAASAADNGSVSRVVFEANGSALPAVTSSPYAVSYAVPSNATGLTVRATATDDQGKTATAERAFAVVPDPLTTVAGRVVDGTGQPIAAAAVTISGQPSAQSAADGSFSVAGLPTVNGDISVSASVLIDGRQYVSQSKTVAPVAGGTASAGDLVIQVRLYEFRYGSLSSELGTNWDDTTAPVTLPFPFTFYGQTYTQAYLGSNGYLTFGRGDTELNGAPQYFANGAPRISALFNDWVSPGAGLEGIYVNNTLPGRVVFTWRRVPWYPDRNRVASFQIIIFQDGRVQLGYNGVLTGDGTVGISPGGSSAAAQSYDLSAMTSFDVGPLAAPYQLFTDGGSNAFDLDHYILLFTPRTGGGYTVSVQPPPADRTPPAVTQVAPADAATGVAQSSQVVVTFNEQLAADQNFADVLRVYPDPSLATPVPGSYSLDATGRALTFAPASPFEDGARYGVLVVGQRDPAGNEQPARVQSFFVIADTTGPRITSFTINGQQAVDGMTIGSISRPVFSASYQDGSGVDTSRTYLTLTPAGGTPSRVAASVSATGLSYQPADSLPAGTNTAELVATDVYGHVTTTGPIGFTIVPGAPTANSISSSFANRFGNTLLTIKGQNLLNLASLPDSDTGKGLTGEYYSDSYYWDSSTFFNTLKRAQTDATVDFDWGGGTPLCCFPYPPVGADNFMVRWTGQVKPLYSETYTFYTVSDDGIRLWVNGQLVVDSWVLQAPTEHSGSITLEAGRKYDIKIEYYEAGGGAVARLLWSSPSQPKQVVPQSQLFPSRVSAPEVYVNGVKAQVMGAAESSPGVEQVAFIAPGGDDGAATVEVRTDHGSGFLPAGSLGYYDTYPVPLYFDPPPDGSVRSTGQIKVAYDQPIDPTYNLQQIIRVYTAACGDGCARTYVTGTVSLDPAGRIGTFTPAQPLGEGRFYFVETRGFRSVNGLTWDGYWWIRFNVLEGTPPAIDDWKFNGSNLNGATIPGGTPQFTTNFSDYGSGPDFTSAVVTLDGVRYTSGGYTLNTTYDNTTGYLYFTPPAPLSAGAHTLSMKVSDKAGNQAEKIASFNVDPTIEVTSMSISGGSRHGGQLLELHGRGLVFGSGAVANVRIGGRNATNDVNSSQRGYPPYDACPAAQKSVGTCITVRTPPGAPGNATLEVVTDHGTATVAGGFTYDNDQQMPFEVESDTVLLWDFQWDESDMWNDNYYPGAVWSQDFGPRSLDVSDIYNDPNGYQTTGAPSRGVLTDGRFYEGGVKDVAAVAVEDYGALGFGDKGFTVEGWVKTDPSQTRTRTHTLFGKENVRGQNTDFALGLLPSGQLRAQVYNAAGAVWEATTDPTVFNMNDGQWHSLALVVERGDQPAQSRLVIYGDGEERASAPAPDGFGPMRDAGERFRIGNSDADGPGDTTKSYFPGSMDEIRVSATAHTADTIRRTYNAASQMGLVISDVKGSWYTFPPLAAIQRGKAVELLVTGYNLFGATPSVTAADGTPLPVTAEVRDAGQSFLRVRFTADASAPLGDARLLLTAGGNTATAPVRIIDPQPFASDQSTLLLWHLDSGTFVADSGPFGIGGTSRAGNSQGLFGAAAGRDVLLTANDDNGVLNFGDGSFSVQFWLRTDQRYEMGSYTLAGREDAQGQTSDFSLTFMATHDLRAQVYNAAGQVWEVIMPANAADVADFRWHQVSLVVDRAAGKMSVYVDGTVRASGPAPANFGAVRYTPANRFRAGNLDLDGPSDSTNWAPSTYMFGYMDDMRVLDYALTPGQVLNTWLGLPAQSGSLLRRVAPSDKSAAAASSPPSVPDAAARSRFEKQPPARALRPSRETEVPAEPPPSAAGEQSRGGVGWRH